MIDWRAVTSAALGLFILPMSLCVILMATLWIDWYKIPDWCNTNVGFTSAVLAVITLFVSLYAIFVSTRAQRKVQENAMKQQREIHNRDVKLAFQQKILEIFNAFSNCLRLLKAENAVLIAKTGLAESHGLIYKIEEHRVTIRRVLEEANLFIIDDKPLLDTLLGLFNDFMLLSDSYIELTYQARDRSFEVFREINKTFNLGLNVIHPPREHIAEMVSCNMPKIKAHSQALEMYNNSCATNEFKQFEEALSDFSEKFSEENFEERFRKHLILKGL